MTILTATATKESLEGKMGIAFTRSGEDKPLTIKSMKEDSIFKDSGADFLKEGMIVETVNGEPMTWKTPKDAADVLRAAEPGQVSIAVHLCIGEVVKEDQKAKLGISLKNSTTKPGIFVSKINEEGLFANSELAPGQKILYINDTPCPNDCKKAIALVKEAVGALKIVAAPLLTPPPIAAADVLPPTVAPMVEEKKEDDSAPKGGEEAAAPKEGEEADATTEDKEVIMSEDEKGLVDKIFSSCIC